MASAITTPDEFGDTLNFKWLQTEIQDRTTGLNRSAQHVNIFSSGDGSSPSNQVTKAIFNPKI